MFTSPPNTNTKVAAKLVAADANAMLAKYSGAPVFILGDYNSCRLDNVLPSFQQYVDIPTRRENILDLCYDNITDAFHARSYPPPSWNSHQFFTHSSVNPTGLPQYSPSGKPQQ